MIQLILVNLPAQRIAVNSQQSRRAGLIAVKTLQHALDKFFLKLIYCFVEMNSAIDHHSYQRFQLLLHRGTLRM